MERIQPALSLLWEKRHFSKTTFLIQEVPKLLTAQRSKKKRCCGVVLRMQELKEELQIEGGIKLFEKQNLFIERPS